MATQLKVVCVKLNVKVGRRFVYLHHTPGTPIGMVDAMLSVGPDEQGDADFAYCFLNQRGLDKSTKRKIRKALCAAGRPDIAAYTVPPKPVSLTKMFANIPF